MSATPRHRDRYSRRRRLLAHRALAAPPRTPVPAISPEIVEQLEESFRRADAELAAARDEVVLAREDNAQLREAVARQRAEFDNFRRRTLKEKEQIRSAASEKLLTELLPVIDNFDRALHSASQATDAAAIRDGVEMVAVQLLRILESEGLERIEPLGEPFDYAQHEALAVEERDDVPENQVVEVMLPGFRFGERVIRPAMVKVARHPQQESVGAQETDKA